MRIVSLVPSSTETLLGLGADVVACTRFCEQPDIAHVGGTKNPDIEAIVALAPDLVVVDREENRREDAEALDAAGIELFISDVTTVAGAMQVTRDLSALVGGPTISDRLPEFEPLGLSVFVPIWRRPWMTINKRTYGASVLGHLGCRLVTADLAMSYPEIELDALGAFDADVIAVPSEPYEFNDHHLDELRTASPRSVVARVDGQDLFWWGSRTPGALERLHDSLGETVN
jgi:ABC-type Fe3+-hydroxamate transport system substrate-binding protein